jgi:hypothetical protein
MSSSSFEGKSIQCSTSKYKVSCTFYTRDHIGLRKLSSKPTMPRVLTYVGCYDCFLSTKIIKWVFSLVD